MGINYNDIINMPLPGEGMAPQQEPVIGDYWGGDPNDLNPLTEAGPGGVPYAPGQQPGDVYFAGEEFQILKGLTIEDRVRLQQQLVAVGLASTVMYGEMDENTVKGFRSVLAMANRQGEPWTATLGRIATNPALQQDAKQFEERPFLKPDYATLAQRVKQTFREALGRDPDLYEMQQLTGELTGFSEMEHEAATEFERIQHEQQTAPGVQPGGSVSAVDPMARFQELFENKYKHELDFVEDKAQAQTSRQVVEAGASTLSQMSRR